MIVPVLVYFFHMSQHKAQGTSLAALLAPAGALAFWEYYKAGNVDLKAGLIIALGFLVGGYFGGLWAQHLSEMVLRRVFGTFLVIIGIRLLLRDEITLTFTMSGRSKRHDSPLFTGIFRRLERHGIKMIK